MLSDDLLTIIFRNRRLDKDDEDYDMLFLPDSMSYFKKYYQCTHGPVQLSRSTGQRAPRQTRFTGCQARILAQARYDEQTKAWYVSIDNEVSGHPESSFTLLAALT